MLTPKERLYNVMKGNAVDRPPCICPGGMMNMVTTDLMDAVDIYMPEAHTDARMMAGLAKAVYDSGCFENYGVPFCMTVEAEEMGAKVEMGSRVYEPHVSAYAIESVEDYGKLPRIDTGKGRAKVVLDAAVKAGAPEGIIGWIDVPSLELTNEVMRDADLILATGGPGMVKAAYSSGKPALGVGAGNTPVIIDDTADIKMAVNSIIHSKTFDNGMICASEQSVTVMESIYSEVRKEFEYRGCYFLKPGEIDKVRKTIIVNGALNAKIVGQKAATIAKLAGVEVPEDTKILIGEVESVAVSYTHLTLPTT